MNWSKSFNSYSLLFLYLFFYEKSFVLSRRSQLTLRLKLIINQDFNELILQIYYSRYKLRSCFKVIKYLTIEQRIVNISFHNFFRLKNVKFLYVVDTDYSRDLCQLLNKCWMFPFFSLWLNLQYSAFNSITCTYIHILSQIQWMPVECVHVLSNISPFSLS